MRLPIWGVIAGAFLWNAPAIAQNPPYFDQCVNSGSRFSVEVRIEGCTAAIKSGRWRGKDLAWAYENRGIAWKAKGDLDRALADDNQAIQLNPKDGSVYFDRGNLWTTKGDLDRAISDFSEAIRLEWKYASLAYFNRGNRYREKGDQDRAIADYSEAIRLDPKYTPAYVNRGVVWKDKGDFDRAIADATRAIELDSKDVSQVINRGNAWQAEGDFDRAVADFTRALDLYCNHDLCSQNGREKAYDGRARAWRSKGEYDRAIADYDQLIRLSPTGDVYYLNRGQAKLYVRALPDALADLDQASKLDPKYGYTALWLDIVNKRSNLPSRLADAAKQIDMTKWPAPVIRLYLGELTPEAVLAAADDPDANEKKAHVCEANFYTGALATQQGRKDEAKRLFGLAAADCPTTFDEYDGAKAELKALSESTSPPRAEAADCAQAETHWKSAEEIKTLAVYQDHLARFPNCAFSTLAKARIEALQKK